jgi:hypothetical protein
MFPANKNHERGKSDANRHESPCHCRSDQRIAGDGRCGGRREELDGREDRGPVLDALRDGSPMPVSGEEDFASVAAADRRGRERLAGVHRNQ